MPPVPDWSPHSAIGREVVSESTIAGTETKPAHLGRGLYKSVTNCLGVKVAGKLPLSPVRSRSTSSATLHPYHGAPVNKPPACRLPWRCMDPCTPELLIFRSLTEDVSSRSFCLSRFRGTRASCQSALLHTPKSAAVIRRAWGFGEAYKKPGTSSVYMT